jgi:MoaA/NifB/PqqE/SkfB family radical SAM enzyme
MSAGAEEKRHWVRLTRVCNQRCLFCHDRDAQDGTFASWDSIRKSLGAGRAEGLRRVVLSGGEPTVHPRYLDVVALASDLGYEHVQTITNGRRFCYPGFLDAAAARGLREITFSLHGHTPALHDGLTRVPGSFIQAVTALRLALAKPGLIVSVDVVINARNLPVLREHLEFCLALGAREFDLLALVPFSDAWRHRGELFCDFSLPESRAHLRRALELSRRPGVSLWTNRLAAEHLEGFESLIQPPEKLFDELRGRRALFRRRLKGGRMPCAGDACGQCFLAGFCRDLGELLEKGVLFPAPGPLCRPAPSVAPFRFGAEPRAEEFAPFYIASRFYAKGSACASCADAERCSGMSVAEARRVGFGRLTPRAAGRG